MLPRLLHLYPATCRRLTRLSKEAERDGAYRVAKRITGRSPECRRPHQWRIGCGSQSAALEDLGSRSV